MAMCCKRMPKNIPYLALTLLPLSIHPVPTWVRKSAVNVQLQRMLHLLETSQTEVKRKNQKLEFLATRDPLTGCLNRRSFFPKLNEEMQGYLFSRPIPAADATELLTKHVPSPSPCPPLQIVPPSTDGVVSSASSRHPI